MISNFYKSKKILVLGGTGFIGTNLVLALHKLGAIVTVISRGEISISKYVSDCVKYVNLDISTPNPSSLHKLFSIIANHDVIFDFAGRSGAVSSSHGPYDDLQNNVIGQYNILDITRVANPNAHIIFLSSRLVYGKANCLPINEMHPTEPTSFYGINKLTSEKYHGLFYDLYNVKTTVLRVTIPYGPFKPVQQYRHGIINLFLEKAFSNETICLYGDGCQLRDVIYIEDLVAAVLLIPTINKTIGEIYNLGSGQGISLAGIARVICQSVGKGNIRFVEWPEDALKVETGDFYCSIDKIMYDLDWKPTHSLEVGIAKCSEFYGSQD